MGRREYPKQTQIGRDEEHGCRVIEGVHGGILSRDFDVQNAELARQRIQKLGRRGSRNKRGVEVADIGLQGGGGIARWIHGHKQNLRMLIEFRQVMQCHAHGFQRTEGRWTDIRTVGEAEEEQSPFAAQVALVQLPAVCRLQGKCPQQRGIRPQKALDLWLADVRGT